jgi:cytochrome c2
MWKPTVVFLALVTLLLAACGGNSAATPASTGSVGSASSGQKLFAQTSLGKSGAPGCVTCHSLEPGRTLVGPSLAGVNQRAADALRDPGYKGKAKTVAEFLRESIVDANANVAKGFSLGIMYQNYGKDLTPGEIADLVAYLATLK